MFRFICSILTLSISATTLCADPISLGKGTQPRVVSDGGKYVAVVFGRPGEILIADSTDAGTTFAEPRSVAQVKNMPLGMRRGPRVAMTAKAMVISAVEGQEGRGRDGDLFAWVSADNGKTWKKSKKPLNSVAAAAREGLHGMAATTGGKIACVWLDLRNAQKDKPGTEVWMSLSADGGATWEEDRLVYRNAGGTVCECCHPSVVLDDAKNVHVMFRNVKAGARDMYVVSSSDDGRKFSEPQQLGNGTWPLNACPMDGGDLVLDDKGVLQTVWMRAGQTFSATPGQAEKAVGDGRQPVIVATAKGPWTGWINGGALMGQWSGSKAERLADEANFPSAAKCQNGSIVVAWVQGKEVRLTLLQRAP